MRGHLRVWRRVRLFPGATVNIGAEPAEWPEDLRVREYPSTDQPRARARA